MRPMSMRPRSVEDLDENDNEYHFVLTGWKDQYKISQSNLKNKKYFTFPYSSHSSS